MDQRELRNCFGHFATGVCVVTWKDDNDNRKGITINSFTSVSLHPPLVLISIKKQSKSLNSLKKQKFIVNILSAEQKEYALYFARQSQEDLVIDWQKDSDIGPKLNNAVATMECTSWAEYEGGDHLLLLGQVVTFSYNENECLLFHKGKFLQTKTETIIK
ncbi:flavin reductase family protein [Virgibacillus proomii]|uniref:flavin reductase family protein n=1 Tax=Virgibacillus proomii TaxID=84407 RepID=UPI001C1172EE|nr:flavin reductase family protein [Virgibacillus proomii]MBU5267170.1 flavin reductase family protein [Virgibacillus proomii]